MGCGKAVPIRCGLRLSAMPGLVMLEHQIGKNTYWYNRAVRIDQREVGGTEHHVSPRHYWWVGKVGRSTDRHCFAFGAVCFGFVLVGRS